MPTTLTSRPDHSACRLSNNGISLRHGAHQVAQKLMIKDLPSNDAIGVALPVRSSSENFGSCSGILAGVNGPDDWPSVACAKSLGLGALASPAGTGIPGWRCA